jgi:DUF1680 family protein
MSSDVPATSLATSSSFSAPSSPGLREPLPFVVSARLADIFNPVSPGRVALTGFLGQRVAANASRRLIELDLEPLLAGFRRKPGSHPWIGEHIGKWMHAATLAWAYTGDPKLKGRLDYVARELISAQEADGYLGTYTPDVRFGLHHAYADWDVWSHKYCILGLITYYQYTGSTEALAAARGAADLLRRTFGPGRKSILSAGQHVGMAATSVLEAVVLLYRLTGDGGYLDFAHYIVGAWDEPGGPRVLESLTQDGAVNTTADAKAYEMLSNLVGLCELARVTGERRYLIPAQNAWEDIVRNQLYITGTASSGERFRAPHVLPNAPSFNVGETCVTVTWIQLSAHLLRLTGEAKYADELERSWLNHLPAAQRPDGSAWCYYTALEGEKPYGDQITCCQSSGARGMALAPINAYFTGALAAGSVPFVAVTFYESSRATVVLGGREVTIEQTTGFPRSPGATLELSLEGEATFAILLRSPRWAQPLTVRGVPEAAIDDSGFMVVPARAWKRGDRLEIDFALTSRLSRGYFGNSGRAALLWGPIVLAYDEARNVSGPSAAWVWLASGAKAALRGDRDEAGWSLSFTAPILTAGGGSVEERAAVLVPFADAGGTGGTFRVWLGAPEAFDAARWSVLVGGRESRSALGNVTGSILDGNPETFVVTYDGRLHNEDYFAVELDSPRKIGRIVYTHGKTFHDGGWFDASAGVPRIEIRRSIDAEWEALGPLDGYPRTTMTDAAGLTGGESFVRKLAEPVTAIAVRIIGVPASGDDPRQSFASCAELAAFEE